MGSVVEPALNLFQGRTLVHWKVMQLLPKRRLKRKEKPVRFSKP